MATDAQRQNWVALGEDILVYLGKSAAAFIMSIVSFVLMIIAWVSSGISIVMGKLSDSCFLGSRLLNTRLTKIRWYKKP